MLGVIASNINILKDLTSGADVTKYFHCLQDFPDKWESKIFMAFKYTLFK